MAAESRSGNGAIKLRLSELRLGPNLREGGVDAEHVRALAELDECWPPILISKHGNRVIDGVHRFHAAKALGHTEIACVYFSHGPDEEFLEFVRRNTTHGLPLTLKEREQAARSLLRMHGNWSDRRIAEPCGISPVTVARLRGQVAQDPDSGQASSDGSSLGRIGKDRRVRPIDATATRKRIAAALDENPNGSLRSIAAAVGASPETVRNVRAERERHQHPRLENSTVGTVSQISASLRELNGPFPLPPDEEQRELSVDSAMQSTPQGRQFADWFAHNDVDNDWREHVPCIPLSRVYEVADEARRRAACWAAFAETLESRITRRGAVSA